MPLATGDVLASYAYEFEVEGISIAQFAQVSGVSGSIGVIEHRTLLKAIELFATKVAPEVRKALA